MCSCQLRYVQNEAKGSDLGVKMKTLLSYIGMRKKKPFECAINRSVANSRIVVGFRSEYPQEGTCNSMFDKEIGEFQDLK